MPLHTRLRRELDLRLPGGALVLEVTPNGPAAQAGLLPGDTIIGFAGEPVGSVDGLHRLLTGGRAGQSSTVDVLRRGERRTLEIIPEAS